MRRIAAAADAIAHELFDPWRGERVRRNVDEHRSRRRGGMYPHAVFRAQNEDRHLRAQNRIAGAVEVRRATAGDSFARELLDERRRECAGRDVSEHRSGGRRRDVAAAVLAAFQEDRHLVATHRGVGTVAAAAAPARDSGAEDLLDLRVERMGLRDVVEIGEDLPLPALPFRPR
ncbi:MAG: hypothetical protein ACXWH1_14565 [Thermoanaerobaculia bacterium]